MYKLLIRTAIIVVIISGFAQPVFAWWNCGHMVVACIAYRKLTPETKARVNTLVRLNPYYSTWNQTIASTISGDDRDMIMFMLASTWPDAIKKDEHYKSDGAEGGNKPEEPTASENIGYSDTHLHKYWHYVDRAFSTDKTRLPSLPVPNAQTQIDAFRATLNSDSPDLVKSYDLAWLAHMVGDVHQPLHCATRASHGDPNGDKGGNDVKVDSLGGPTNLHAFWDSALGSSENPQDAAKIAESLPDAGKRSSLDLNTKDWVAESFKLVKDKVYKTPIKQGNGPFKLTQRYEDSVRAVAKKRAELAGARLANVLNRELK